MYNAWVMNIQAKPPVVILHLQVRDQFQLKRAAQLLADSQEFGGPMYTIVTECNAESLGIEDA